MFTEELKKARKAKNMTQKEAAQALHIDTSTYCGYETGKREPDMARLRSIASLFDVQTEQLLFGDKLNRLQYVELRDRVDIALGYISSSDMKVLGIDDKAIVSGFRNMRPIRIEQAKMLAKDLGFSIDDLFTNPQYTDPSPFTELGIGYFEEAKDRRLMACFTALNESDKEKVLSYMEFLRKAEE